MLDQVNKLQKCVKVCILKAGIEENISPQNMVKKIRQPSQIIFTHPDVLIENRVFSTPSRLLHLNIASRPLLLMKHI